MANSRHRLPWLVPPSLRIPAKPGRAAPAIGRWWYGRMGINLFRFLRRTPCVVLRSYFAAIGLAVMETIDWQASTPILAACDSECAR